ncbi:MAG: lipid asymmetry maintenance protein MlaB [Methylophilaceae bacterium]|jgi:anti-sigma B factor antagonist|nr:STAS domain-containing protein [Methylophilaceae bacterium]
MANSRKTGGGQCRHVVEGEMTIYRAAELKDELMSKIDQHQEIEIDLSGVSEIDTAGLQLMVLAKLEASNRDKRLRFDGHSRAVMEILDLSDLAGFFGDPVVISSQPA